MKTKIRDHIPGELLIESSIDAMIGLGHERSIIVWNNAASVFFNLANEESIVGKELFDVIPSAATDENLLIAITRGLQGKKSFLAASDKFSHRIHAETHVIPLLQENEVMGVMLLIHDVAHRITKEKELHKINELLKSRIRQLRLTTGELAQLANIASHNIRDPIREIYTAVEAMLRWEAEKMSNSGKASFRRIQSSLNRMNLLLDDIITLTGINIAEPPGEMVDIGKLLSEIQSQLSKKIQDSRTDLQCGEYCEIRAHRNQMHLLLYHIFTNIIRFNEPGPPQIYIECRKMTYSRPERNVETKEYYELVIIHNSNAFESVNSSMNLADSKFSDQKGLAGPAIAMMIINKVMEAHNGFFTIDRTEAHNNRIRFYFPVETDVHPDYFEH